MCAPFVIAEAAFNHGGNLNVAREMIRTAAAAGCDAIKFQTYKTEEFCRPDDPMYGEFKRGEFPETAWGVLKSYCNDEDITFLSTPQNPSDLDILLKVAMPAVKVGSDDLANIPLLKHFAAVTEVPLILSCGMSDMGEVHRALNAVGAFDGRDTVLMVCTSQYPCPPEEANLSRITTLRAAFPKITIGYSDHTQWIEASIAAVALGAEVFEKHFALQPEGTVDHAHALGPKGLEVWVRAIRKAHAMLGDGLVRPSPAERISKQKYQRRPGELLRGLG